MACVLVFVKALRAFSSKADEISEIPQTDFTHSGGPEELQDNFLYVKTQLDKAEPRFATLHCCWHVLAFSGLVSRVIRFK